MKPIFRIPVATALTISLTSTISTTPAEAAQAVLKGLPIKFSKIVYDSCRDLGGSILYCLLLDPEPSPGIVEIGTEIEYDSSKVRILPESSGFLCDFSIDGSCPPAPLPEDFDQVITLGNPRADTTFNLSVTDDTIILNHDLSGNPTPPLEEDFFFFAIAFETIDDQEVDINDFVQQIDSPNQVCRTTDERFSCGVSVPEASSSFSLISLGFLGLGSTYICKKKQKKSAEE